MILSAVLKPILEMRVSLFWQNSELKEITLPDSLKILGNHAFNKCTKLTTVNFGTGLQEIGYSAFKDCTSLTRVELPDGPCAIGHGLFENCTI